MEPVQGWKSTSNKTIIAVVVVRVVKVVVIVVRLLLHEKHNIVPK